MKPNELSLRYGMNPHQVPASVAPVAGEGLPFRVLNGRVGYINLLDALKGWQICREMAEATGLPAACVLKHTNPVGAAVGLPLSREAQIVFGVQAPEISDVAAAYVRARACDPVASYGDFTAVSETVDVTTARLIKQVVSDGIVAPAYEPEALRLLREKKGGNYLIMEMDPEFEPPSLESADLFGIRLTQHRNSARINSTLLERAVTRRVTIDEEVMRDLIIATIVVKYCQSNAVCIARDGQTLGIGVGQQSRIQCTRIACDKAEQWWLRWHPYVQTLKFRAALKQYQRANALEGLLRWSEATDRERERALTAFEGSPVPLTSIQCEDWMNQLSNLSLSSDGFIPFRDNIDRAVRAGVGYVLQPGGSARDDEVIAACNEYGIWMAFSGLRLFYH
ncbi:MAG TPA: phosphoribosylaminoimidazolecarboxamide formyltransferase [Gemmatimonadaceae bacterium]|nr:phosphoribosylaminoimidazolecarboxamide formyltransferase [Gemmatimonadaceae bacterium]